MNSAVPRRNSGLTKSTQSGANQKLKRGSQVKKTDVQGKLKSAKLKRVKKQQDPDAAENKKTEEIFHNLCKMVDGGKLDFSDCFDAGEGVSVPLVLRDSPSSVHAQYDPSYLERRLPGKKNLLHYAVSQAIFEDTDEDIASDDDGQYSAHDSSDEDDALAEDDVESEAEYREPDDNSQSCVERRCNFIIWLLQRYPGMLSECTSANKTPLCLLIEQSRDIASSSSKIKSDFLVEAAQRVLGNDKVRGEFEKILADRNRGTIIHLAIKYFGSRVVPFVSLVKGSAMSVQDNDGSTPLHIAVDVKHWKNDDIQQRVQLIRELVKKCDREALTKKRGNPNWKEELLKSPYVYMMSQANDLWPSPGQQTPDEKASFELAAYHLKDAYMSLDDHDVFEHLHRGQKSYYLRLDLSEVNATNLLDNIEEYLGHMRVDTILKEVCLPGRLLIGQLPKSTDDSVLRITHDVAKRYRNYSGVFDWLRDKGVKKIHKLTVVDNEFLPHSDDAIVKALQDIEVDTWNWIQDDLCSDTIVSAARKARHVHLYSTGKKAVLQNWCAGLGRLEHLEKIDLSVDLKKRPISGDPEDRNYEKKYKCWLEKAFPNLPAMNIRVKVESLKDKSSAENVSKKKREEYFSRNETSHWVDQMKRFAQFVHNIPSEVDGRVKIKIAIIDDGVNIEQIAGTPRSIEGGMSFHNAGPEEKRGRHHFPSSFGHGTKMVDCVLQVFPKAKLYIARIETLRGEGQTQPTLTSASAAEGIEWAVKQNVDIILMSWTIEENDESKEGLQKMKTALGRANEKEILLFCAAKDIGGPWSNNPGYPKNSNVPMFCVGGATSNGKKSEKVGDQPVDILCPENFPDSRPRGNPDAPGPAGSSIATALAVGVTGLLLYCISLTKIIKGADVPYRTSDAPSPECMELRRYRVMKAILDSMVDTSGYLTSSMFAMEDVLPFGEGGEDKLEEIIDTIQVQKRKALQAQ